MSHDKVMKEMREDCDCQNTKYCPLEVLLLSFGDRMLEQHKLVEKFKYELGVSLKREVDWNEAYKVWVEDGHAERFAKVYDDNKTFRQMYKEIVNGRFEKKKNGQS